MQKIAYFSLIFLLKFSLVNSSIGKCDLSAAPPSWLSTNATGILDFATSGQSTNGTNFCIQRNEFEQTIQVAYHIDLGNSKNVQIVNNDKNRDFENQNGCVNKNTRIVYCFALCLNSTLQNLVIESALKSNKVDDVANDIQRTVHNNWATTVLQVDYNNPKTHLNASSFLVADAWCSVYVGVHPSSIGFDWLYEIQLGKILQ